MSVLARLSADTAPQVWVSQKPDVPRILDLPVYDPNGDIPDMGAHLRLPGGSMDLRDLQNRALYYAVFFGGLLGFIGVGRGKTLICSTLPVLLQQFYGIAPGEVVLIIPPDMRRDLAKEWAKYGPHFKLAHGLTVITYNGLSGKKNTGLLERLKPKAIICDEADKLLDQKTSTTGRVKRYMRANPSCMFFAMSGTLGRKSIKDWAHLAKWALGVNAPVPLSHGTLATFALALDVVRHQKRKGIAEKTGGESPREKAKRVVASLQDKFGGDTLRAAFQRRLVTAPGVVVSEGDKLPNEAIITPRNIAVPEQIADLYDALTEEWQLPDGSLTEDGLELNRKQRELSMGLYYTWVWPNDEPDHAWLDARQNWLAAARAWRPKAGVGTDSLSLIEDACLAMLWHRHNPQKYPAPVYEVSADCYATYAVWARQKHKKQPPTKAVWLNHFAIFDACEWAERQPTPPLLWYEHEAVGEVLAKVSGYRLVGPGAESNQLLATLSKPEPLVISRNAHYRGKNLQDRWHRNLCMCLVSSGALVEQWFGRTMRPGQPSPQVHYAVNTHTSVLHDSLRYARTDARFIEDTHGTLQILNHATYRKTVRVPLAQPRTVPGVDIKVLPQGWGYFPQGYADVPAGFTRHPKDIARINAAIAQR